MILRYTLKNFPVQPVVYHTTHQDESKHGQSETVPNISEIKHQWNIHSQSYKGTQMTPLTFYYSFLSLMNIQNAKNILDVGCGNGKLIPVAVMMKSDKATYLATDLAQNMVQNTKNNLKQNFEKYYSKLTFDQWCQKQNLSFKCANGEDIIQMNMRFDRIICNCVLMITENPENMLKSLYSQAQSGCLLGVSVWGDRNKNPLLQTITDVILQYGGQKQNINRSEFHLYGKVSEIAEKVGWKTLLRWQQNALIPALSIETGNLKEKLSFFMDLIPLESRKQALQKIRQKAKDLFENKEGLNFSVQMYILEKP